MPQLTFSLRAGNTPGQQRLGSRTTRMLEVDLHDLEREAAQKNDNVFSPLGVSYIRERFDDQFEGIEGDVDLVRPADTSTATRLIGERNKLLCRLMARSPDWERWLADMAGGVMRFTSVDPNTGEPLPDDQQGPLGGMVVGQPADPWRVLNEHRFPYPDPMVLDALYADDADPREIHISRPYRDICPWLWDDRDEMKVVQWTVDRLGWSPWPGSWDEYLYLSERNKHREEDGETDIFTEAVRQLLPPDIHDPALPSHFREVYIRAAKAASQRQKEFVYAHEPKPKQATFAW